jgi:hypothetical protein
MVFCFSSLWRDEWDLGQGDERDDEAKDLVDAENNRHEAQGQPDLLCGAPAFLDVLVLYCEY